jgi:cell division septation protein DedD
MRGVFDDKELEPPQARRDTELTLGSGTLIAIFFGLVLLCGLCFGLGYTVGHRGSQISASTNAQTGSAIQATEPGNSLAKPPATAQVAPTPPPPDAADAEQPAVDPSGTAPAAAAETLPAPVQAGTAPSQPLVHPALTLASAAIQSGQPATAANPRATLTPVAAPASAGALMVQIAAVSNAEDADVLTNALRKRGYAVTTRRDPADNLIHVRIGPFATVAEANSWKMKLLNDGYNAIVQP